MTRITREADYNYYPHIYINYVINMNKYKIIQIVTERYMFEGENKAYFTLNTNTMEQGEGS